MDHPNQGIATLALWLTAAFLGASQDAAATTFPPADVVRGSTSNQSIPGDRLMDASYSDLRCDTGAAVGGFPLQSATGPALALQFPNSVQYAQPFAFRLVFDLSNPASYALGGGITQHNQSSFNFGLRLPLPVNASQTSIGLAGGSWNTAWGGAPALTNSNSYLQAAQGTPAGVPGGNPASIDFPDVVRQLVASGNAGSTIDVVLPGSGDFNSPTFFFQRRISTSGPIAISSLTHAVRCLPGSSGQNVTLASIQVVALQPQITITATPNGTIAAGSQLTLAINVSSVSGVLNGGTAIFERVGGSTVGTTTLSNGTASVTISAPTTPGSVSYRARFQSGNANIANVDSSSVTVNVQAAALSALTVVSGSAQSAAVGQSFAPLVVRARDAFDNPIANTVVTFSAPTSGASAVLSSTTATTAANGQASINATANALAGSYAVTARVNTVQTTFNLTNVIPASVDATIAAVNPLTIPGAQPGGSVSFTVALTSTGTLPGPVALSVSGLPAGTTTTFSANNLTPPATTTLTVQTSAATPLGTHPFTLTATSGSLVDTVASAFHVTHAIAGSGVIGIDFVGDGTPMLPNEVAGVVARPNWNAADSATGGRASLFDESGASTAVAVEWDSIDGHVVPIIDAPGDARMMRGYLDAYDEQATTIAVDGLPANPGGYLVYLYTDGDNVTSMATRTGAYRLVGDVAGDTRIEVVDLSTSNFTGSFLRALGGAGNYAVFRMLGTGFVLTATPVSATDSNLRAAINAIQIVPADLLFFDGFD